LLRCAGEELHYHAFSKQSHTALQYVDCGVCQVLPFVPATELCRVIVCSVSKAPLVLNNF
jgi:hypothetical protein